MAPNMGWPYINDLALSAKEDFCVYIHHIKVHYKKVNFLLYGNRHLKSLYVLSGSQLDFSPEV
jgi:hypothetical protein